ncbi:MAG: hypothetical protein ABL998_20805, partial [Planctomycetota bacterium]
MGGRERVAWDDPRNAGVLAYLVGLERLPGYVASAAPESVDAYQLGAHPDWVEVLWQTLDASLPTRCAWVVHGRATLVRRSSGVLFGLALGTIGCGTIYTERTSGPQFQMVKLSQGITFDQAIETLG